MDYTELTSQMPQMSPQMIAASVACGVIACLLGIIVQWKLFTKAGEAGWKSIIPIYNIYTLCKIVDGNGVKCLLFFIPVVNLIYAIILCFRMAKAYGKGGGFGFGLLVLPIIFQLILAFGSAKYVGPKGIPAAAPAEAPAETAGE